MNFPMVLSFGRIISFETIFSSEEQTFAEHPVHYFYGNKIVNRFGLISIYIFIKSKQKHKQQHKLMSVK